VIAIDRHYKEARRTKSIFQHKEYPEDTNLIAAADVVPGAIDINRRHHQVVVSHHGFHVYWNADINLY